MNTRTGTMASAAAPRRTKQSRDHFNIIVAPKVCVYLHGLAPKETIKAPADPKQAVHEPLEQTVLELESQLGLEQMLGPEGQAEKDGEQDGARKEEPVLAKDRNALYCNSRSREVDSVGFESALLCREGGEKRFEGVFKLVKAAEKRKHEVDASIASREKRIIASSDRRKRHKHSDLQHEYDKNRKGMTRGAGRHRFDATDEKDYYKNVGSAAAEVNMGGGFETGQDSKAEGEQGTGNESKVAANGKLLLDEHQQQHEQSKSESADARAKEAKVDARKTPIILVPNNYTAMLNTLNAVQFLQNGRYITPEDARKSADEDEPPTHVTISRVWDRNEPVVYQVWNRISDPQHWKRVVAVIVDGTKWQFKEWPYKGCKSGDMVDAFQRMRAIHLKWSSDALKASVQKWNVKVLDIDRNSRYKDTMKTQEFWREIDAFMAANNRHRLKY